MTTRAGKFSAAFRVTRDERAQLAEELMVSIDHDDDDDDAELGWQPAREELDLIYAGDADDYVPPSGDQRAPVSEERWDGAQLRLTRSS